MWHRGRKAAGQAVPGTADKAEQAAEFKDALAEEAGEIRDLAQKVHEAAEVLERPPATDHPAIDLRHSLAAIDPGHDLPGIGPGHDVPAIDPGHPVHFPPLRAPATPPGGWHAGHVAAAPGADLADLGLDIVTPLLGAVLAGLAEGSRRARWRSSMDQMIASQKLALSLSRLPTVVDPAVSFAPGTCCFVMISSDDEATILPGGPRRAFRRQCRALEREHRVYLLASSTARTWIMLIHRLPGLRLTPTQLDEITAWIGKEGQQRPRAWPIVAVLPAPRPAGQPGSQAPPNDQR